MQRLHSYDRTLRRWVWKTARENLWRMPDYIDLDDLMQDAEIVFLRCADRYKHVKGTPHFAALFRKAFQRRLIDLSRKRRKAPEIAISQLTDDAGGQSFQDWLDAHGGLDTGSAELQAFLRRATGPAKKILDLVFTPEGRARMKRRPQRRGEKIDQYLARMIGLDPRKLDVYQMVKSVWEPTPEVS